jgi:hypothetical protein
MDTLPTSPLPKEAIPLVSTRKKPAVISRYFYVFTGVLALLFVVAGFSGTYLIPVSTGTFAGRTIHHIHGLVYFLWIILMIVQPILVQTHKIRIHKKIGYAGFALAMAMIIAGITLAISAAHLKVSGGGDVFETKARLVLPFTDMFFFASFIGLALLNLKNGAAHKRLMVLATLAILPAAFGRIFPLIGITTFTPVNILLALLLQESILFLGMLHDRFTRKKIHPVYLWGGITIMIIHLIRIPLGSTPAWQFIAGWLTGL